MWPQSIIPWSDSVAYQLREKEMWQLQDFRSKSSKRFEVIIPLALDLTILL